MNGSPINKTNSGFTMLFNKSTFIGIDPTAGKAPFVFAALDHKLGIIAMGKGNLDSVMAFVGGQEQAFVAINAPRQLNQGLMSDEAFRDTLNPRPRPGRWTGFRAAEYELRQHNIRTPRTPAKETKCPNWMKMGFQVFWRLESLGYSHFPEENSPRQVMEVYPFASYAALLGVLPFPKKSLEGRLQRQLLLHSKNVDILDPMRIFEEITRFQLLQGILQLEGLHTPSELDALVAAYTAWQAAREPSEIALVGHPREGQVVLPVKELQPKYQ